MAQAKGYKGQTVIDFETTFKTSPTSKAGLIIPFNRNQVQASQTLTDPATITGTRNPVSPIMGNESVDGSLEIPLDFRAVGYILKGMFGDPTTTSSGSTYTHVFKVGASQPSMVVEKAFLDIGKYFLYNGCKISSFKLPFGGDGEAVATVDIIGAKETIGTTAYDGSATAVALDRAQNFQASITADGSSISTIKEGDITIDLGLDGDQYCVGDNGTRGDIPEGIVNITGTMSALFTDTNFVDKAKAGTKCSLELVYTKGTKSLSFKFPEIQYERQSPVIDGTSGVLCNCNFRAFYDSDSAQSAVVVTLINDVASY